MAEHIKRFPFSFSLARRTGNFHGLGAWLLACLATAEFLGCQPQGGSADIDVGGTEMGTWGRSSASLSILPPAVSFQLVLEDRSIDLLLHRSPAPTSADYQSYTLNAEGVLEERLAQGLECSYRGRATTRNAQGAESTGFVSVNLCSASTGYPLGQAVTGVLVSNGQLWDITPLVDDPSADDGIEHRLTPSARGGPTGSSAQAPPGGLPQQGPLLERPTTGDYVQEFREGTPQETKYVEVILVNDAARVEQQGVQVETEGLALIEAANALLADSQLSPRVRIVLRAQVNFSTDPFPKFSNNTDVNGDPLPLSGDQEVDHARLLQSFLSWATSAPLPQHDEHILLSGLDFFQNSAGLAPVAAACLAGQNGFLVQADGAAPGASLGFSILSTVHELGHTLGMSHDPNSNACPDFVHIMSAVGCSDCPIGGIDFSPCSQQDFTNFLASPNYQITRCADDPPAGPAIASCGDGVVSPGESCDCGSENCNSIDPCCDGVTCQLIAGATCSDYNDGCCAQCQVVSASVTRVCRPQRSECDTEEVCTGLTAQCPDDTFLAAGGACQDDSNHEGVCYLGICKSRGPQCEQLGILLKQQDSSFDSNLSAPGASCTQACGSAVCTGGPTSGINCLEIGGTIVTEGVACDGGQCVAGSCIALVDQCPNNETKTAPGLCGCDQADEDRDADGTLDCFDACPDDSLKQTEGACGCGLPETDADFDGTPDCVDACPTDASKVKAGLCGCGMSDADDDGDGIPNCADECPATAGQASAGACGCGAPDTDRDGDGVADCNDDCPDNAKASSLPCPDSQQAGIENNSDDDPDDLDDRVALRVKTKDSLSCSFPGARRSSSGTSMVWWVALGALLVARKRRSVSLRKQ